LNSGVRYCCRPTGFVGRQLCFRPGPRFLGERALSVPFEGVLTREWTRYRYVNARGGGALVAGERRSRNWVGVALVCAALLAGLGLGFSMGRSADFTQPPGGVAIDTPLGRAGSAGEE